MANFELMLLAAAVQVFLTLFVLLLLGVRRRRAFNQGKVGKDALINDRSWPIDALQVSNNYKSQFEVPVLFFAAIAVCLALGMTGDVFVWLAWIFVAARVLHSIVHCTSNALAPRFSFFFASFLAVAAMWGIIAWRAVVN